MSSVQDRLRGLEQRAEAEFQAGRLRTAREHLESALVLADDDAARASVLGDLAVVAYTDRRIGDAVACAAEALAFDPEQPAGIEVIDMATRQREAAAMHAMRPLMEARAAEFRAMWTCLRINGAPFLTQATLLLGRGRLVFGKTVELGVATSPGFLDGYGYVEARSPGSVIEVGARTTINNCAVLVSEGEGITIGSDCLFGVHVSVLDSDGHDLHPERRRTGRPATAPVRIGSNVFLGNGVRVSKGVTIGDDTVVGADSVVARSLPAGVIAAGVPARVIRELDAD
jgi:maltose O-acetyltransferase